MAVRFCIAQEDATKAQWELNLKSMELRLKAQPPTPPEVREQFRDKIQAGLEVIKRAVQDCSGLLDQPLFTLTSLQDDPTLH